MTVAAASHFIVSHGGASPQKFEKRALTIFRLEPDRYESAHQLDCSLLFPTANGQQSQKHPENYLLANPTNNKLKQRLIVNTVSETQQKQTKGIL